MKRYIAPIVIGVILVLYITFLAAFLWFEGRGLPLLGKIALVAIPIGLAVSAIYVTLERINEIKGGEEDDARKY